MTKEEFAAALVEYTRRATLKSSDYVEIWDFVEDIHKQLGLEIPPYGFHESESDYVKLLFEE